MKKRYFFILFIIIMAIVLILIPKKNEDAKHQIVNIGEVAHSVFYAPMYAALENGYFKDNGLNVKLILTSGADKVSAAVLSGDVEVGFAGAESAIYVYEAGEKDYLQVFAGLTKRDGQFIVSRKDIKNFSLKDLIGKEIIAGRSSGMPALNFLNALKNENIDPSLININYSVDFAALSGTFISGTGDFVNLFEDTEMIIILYVFN